MTSCWPAKEPYYHLYMSQYSFMKNADELAAEAKAAAGDRMTGPRRLPTADRFYRSGCCIRARKIFPFQIPAPGRPLSFRARAVFTIRNTESLCVLFVCTVFFMAGPFPAQRSTHAGRKLRYG